MTESPIYDVEMRGNAAQIHRAIKVLEDQGLQVDQQPAREYRAGVGNMVMLAVVSGVASGVAQSAADEAFRQARGVVPKLIARLRRDRASEQEPTDG